MILTRCPNCSTIFRVTPEQLRVRHGQVRCGSCFATFNALAELTEGIPVSGSLASGTETEAPVATLGPESDEAPTVHETPALPEETPVPEETPPGEDVEFIEIDLPPGPGLDTPVDTVIGPWMETEVESPMEPEGEPTIEIVDIEPSSESKAEIGPEPGTAAAADLVEESPIEPETAPQTAPEEPPAFLAPEPLLHEDTAREPRRWPWWLGTAFALVALLAQAALHFRTELSVRLPETRPALEAACEQLGCDIPLPSTVELLEIEHSDLTPEDGTAGHLLLSATLRNRAAHAQTWPHLELTLTDAHDRPLVRRALAPQEYLPSADVIAAGFPARGEQHLQLALRLTDVPAVGYRLYLFYP